LIDNGLTVEAQNAFTVADRLFLITPLKAIHHRDRLRALSTPKMNHSNCSRPRRSFPNFDITDHYLIPEKNLPKPQKTDLSTARGPL
jgi:hypothetical protein